MPASPAMALTAELIARVARIEPDAGFPPGAAYQTDADYDDMVDRLFAQHRPRDLWVFAYGSLIWKPEIPHTAEATATAHGWHRAFCLRQTRFRGTPDQPGLMMALDRGGQCKGMLYTLPPDDLPAQLDRLFRREFTVKPITNMPRWIKVASEGQTCPALAFIINRASANYARRLTPEAVADILSKACGPIGSGAEYLFHTVAHLEAKGIHDTHLWHLQRLVADRIAL